MRWLLSLLIPGAGPATAILRFLTSTVGVAIIAAAVGFGFGFQTAEHRADLRAARDQIAIVRRDLDTNTGAAALAARQASEIEAKLTKNQERVNDLQKHPPNGDCSLNPDAARRLLHIR